jgi:signal transduction histidine kinase
MLDLIGDVLDLEKIANGDIRLDMEIQNPKPLIQTCLRMIEVSAGKKDIAVQAVYPEGDLPMVNVDALRFKQALLNMLSNAIKYNHFNGQVALECNSGENGIIHVTVSDTGPTICRTGAVSGGHDEAYISRNLRKWRGNSDTLKEQKLLYYQ